MSAAIDVFPAVLRHSGGDKLMRLRVVVDGGRLRAWTSRDGRPELVRDEEIKGPLRRGPRGGYEADVEGGTLTVTKGGGGT